MAIIRVATWNINSVRLRLNEILQFIRSANVDLLCLQEIKCIEEQFPKDFFSTYGLIHQGISGQKSYNGVAILSRFAFSEPSILPFAVTGGARHLTIRLVEGPAAGIRIHNFYVPAGGDEPDPVLNPKFAHKLAFLDSMEVCKSLHEESKKHPVILLGDLNIAPFEQDVWSSKRLENVVSHTPIEREKLLRILERGCWIDAMRRTIPMHQKLYTWWSYRSPDWHKADKGRRLDHIWISAALEKHFRETSVHKVCRGWERPSDHVPVVADFCF